MSVERGAPDNGFTRSFKVVSVQHIFANGDLEVKAIFKNAMDRIALDWDRNFDKDGSVNISATSDGVLTL